MIEVASAMHTMPARSQSDPRRPYQCPGCGRVFRIPATAPDPGLCPNCQAPARSAVPPAVPPVPALPAQESLSAGPGDGSPADWPPAGAAPPVPVVVPLPEWMHHLPMASLGVGGVASLLCTALPLVLTVAAGAAAVVLGGIARAIPPLCPGRKKRAASWGIMLGLSAIAYGGIALFLMKTTSSLDLGGVLKMLQGLQGETSELLKP